MLGRGAWRRIAVVCCEMCLVLGAGASGVLSATAPAAARGGCVKVAIEFGTQGRPVSEATLAGARRVAAANGMCRPSYGAPTGSASKQIGEVKAAVRAGEKLIVLSADDPILLAPALRAAMRAGVTVLTLEDDVPGARDFFIQDTAYNAIGRAVIGAIVKAEGPRATVAWLATTPDSTLDLAWLSAMMADSAAHYPALRFVSANVLPLATPLTLAEAVLHAYPGLKAILALDDASVAGAAQAVSDLRKVGRVGVFGVADPEPNQRYFADGSLQALFGWDATDEGEFTMCVAALAYQHALHAGRSFTCPARPTGSWAVASTSSRLTGATRDTIIFSKPLEFTPQNYRQYDF